MEALWRLHGILAPHRSPLRVFNVAVQRPNNGRVDPGDVKILKAIVQFWRHRDRGPLSVPDRLMFVLALRLAFTCRLWHLLEFSRTAGTAPGRACRRHRAALAQIPRLCHGLLAARAAERTALEWLRLGSARNRRIVEQLLKLFAR